MYRDRHIPLALIMPVDVPVSQWRSNEELLTWGLDLEAALRVCNGRLKDARSFGRAD